MSEPRPAGSAPEGAPGEIAQPGALSAAAHQLKTPLSVIAGYAELLKARGDEETRLEAATRILEAAQRLSAEIDDVLGRLGTYPDEDVASLPPREAARRPRPAGEPPRRVLLIDDDETVRSLLRMTLPAEDFEIIEARDGDEALELAAGEAPDLVVLDWRMPGLSGEGVLTELKARYPELPVIVLTVATEPRHRNRAGSLGADVFLTKPFSPLQLLGTVEQLLP